MNSEVKDISEYLKIKELKEGMYKDRERIFKLKCEMSRLTFDRTVGLYARCVDEIEDLAKGRFYFNEKPDWVKAGKRIVELLEEAATYEWHDGVKQYKKDREEINKIILNSIYHKVINVDFRNTVSSLNDLPQVFVTNKDFTCHIIDKDRVLDENEDFVAIEPLPNVNSKRDIRHFYNRTSFKYLQDLSENYDFDVDRSKLGKVRTITMHY